MKTTAFLVGLLAFALPVGAAAQTGVSGDRVSLPEGPGSLEGIGENVEVDANMGQMSYRVNIPVPAGYGEMTPTVDLRYSSAGGASEVGMGWALPIPAIERMTVKGLPHYTDDDLFTGPGGELVQTSDAEPARYRARNEGGFVRYSWHGRGDGDGGYWEAELPDGRRQYFGADRDGNLVEGARVAGDDGVFRYRLVDQVDVWDHYIRWSYARFGATTLPTQVGWVHDAEGTPRYSVQFEYEGRPDFISDAKPGFLEVVEHRLASVLVKSRSVQIARWAFTYEEGGGLSRLARVERFGLRGTRYEVAFDFEYSQTLDGVCDGQDCTRPYLVEMGSFGASPLSGNVTLVDLNGDALPDFLDTTDSGAHRIALSAFRTPTDHTLGEASTSAIGRGTVHDLSAGNVQTLDVDGNGYADLINTVTGQVLENLATGDWTRQYSLFEEAMDLPDFEADLDPEDGDLTSIRFVDIDNDKRIDVLKSEGAGPDNQTFVYRNTGGGFAALDGVDPLGLGFDSDRLQLADMNGDGLLDAVQLQPSVLRYRLNLGHGRWTSWFTIEDIPFDAEGDLEFLELEDLDNDGLSDLVLVSADEIRYALSRNGLAFGDLVTLTSDDVDRGSLPIRDAGTTVLFADMNASGSTDVVWVSALGDVTYLELFAVQPNLLTRVENGIGMVTEVTYGTASAQAARAAMEGEPWAYRLPFPSNIVLSLDAYDEHSDVHNVTQYDYRDAYYDGVEKVPRGFAHVVVSDPGDETIAAGRTEMAYDVGVDTPYRAGLPLREVISSDGVPLREVAYHYESCPLAGVPDDTALPIEYWCQTRADSTLMEGAVPSQWLTTRVTRSFDGYGNVVIEGSHGVTSVGGGSCAPCENGPEVFGEACGPECLGDESYKENEFIAPTPDGRWIVDRPWRTRSYGRPGSDVYRESLVYYDGEPFVGLPQGELGRGTVTRVNVRENVAGDRIDTVRLRTDRHGNPVESIRETGSLEDADDHRILQTFGPDGLFMTQLDVRLRDLEGEPYTLRQEIRYDDIWSRVAQTSEWFLVRDGEALSPGNASSATYDEFGRLSERFAPEDAPGEPSERLTWRLASPRSSVLIERRSQVGGAWDRATVRCFDGLGRQYQERIRVADDRWLVNGFSVFNDSGKVRTGYDRYQGPTGACDAAEPADMPRQELTYDATGRVLTDTWFAGEERWASRNEYGPGYGLVWDHNDMDPESPHFDTPKRTDYDGQGRNNRVTLMLTEGEQHVFRFTHDELGRLRGVVDPQGNEKRQTYDLRDQLIGVDDPDRGVTRYERDAAGNVVREVDARGIETVTQVDAMGRLRRQWDDSDPAGTVVEYQFDFPRNCPAELCTNAANRLVEVSFPLEGLTSGHDWYGYDPGGNLVAHERQLDGRAFRFGWDYDHTDILTQRTYPDGRSFSFGYDAAQRLNTVDGLLTETRFHDTGARVASRRLANGVTEELGFDGRYRVKRRDVTGASGAVLAYRYEYDATGNILGLDDDTVSGDVASQNATFRYDGRDRLVWAQLDPGRGALEEVMSYGYDAIGNLTSKLSSKGGDSSDHVGALQYGGAGPHAVTQAGEMTFAYDPAGNMTRRGDAILSWDSMGRLASVETGEEDVRFAYGPGYNRVLKSSRGGRVWYVAEDYEVRDGVAAILIEADEVAFARHESATGAVTVLSDVAPADGDGVIDVADAWVSHAGTLGLQEVDADPAEQLLRAATARLLVGDGTATWLHTDHTGTTVATTDDAGEVLERLAYYPHGGERGTAHLEVAGFQGKERDRETGMIHFGARHLDPWLGRWISPDPAFAMLDEPALRNADEETGAYAFVGNNPARYRDGNGQFLGLVVRGISGLVGGAVGAYDWLKDTHREAEILNQKATLTAQVGWATAGFALGAATGFLTPSTGVLSNLVDLGISRPINEGLLPKIFAGQNLVTARRYVRTFTTAAVSVGVILGLSAVTGGVAPALGLAITGAAFVGKLIYYANDHAVSTAKQRDADQIKQIESTQRSRKRGSSPNRIGNAGASPPSAVDGAESSGGFDSSRSEGETPEAASKRRKARRAGNRQLRRRAQ